MRLALLVAFLLSLAGSWVEPAPPTSAANCDFVLGFKVLRDMIPDEVGECVENERHDPASGDAFQRTNRGLLYWRKSDSHTAFTDGFRTWVMGPSGAEQRLNTELFQWEAAQQLANTEYRLPQDSQDTSIPLVNGQYSRSSPPLQIHAGLISDQVAVGDLDGDGIADAAAPVFLNTGGSGVFIYLIALVNRNGLLVQQARDFLGDRVKINDITISDNGVLTVDMVVQGPTDPLCCPTQPVTQSYRLQGNELVKIATTASVP